MHTYKCLCVRACVCVSLCFAKAQQISLRIGCAPQHPKEIQINVKSATNTLHLIDFNGHTCRGLG